MPGLSVGAADPLVFALGFALLVHGGCIRKRSALYHAAKRAVNAANCLLQAGFPGSTGEIGCGREIASARGGVTLGRCCDRPTPSSDPRERRAGRALAPKWRAGGGGGLARGLVGLSTDLLGSAYDLLLLAALPLLYVASAYLVLDLPLRWMTRREPLSLPGAGEFVAAALIGAVGVRRAVRGTPPIAPVSSGFARTLLCVGWAAALLLAWADLAS